MARTKTWEISDAFWALVEPLIPTSPRNPEQNYKRRPGAGRKPKYSNRTYFAAMVSILRTGSIWNALPREKFGGLGSSALHHKFQQWTRAGFFRELWRKGLAEYDEMAGIAWHWQAADGTNIEAPLARESVGPNPTDRGKKREQAQPVGGRSWRPFVACRERGQSARQHGSGTAVEGASAD